MKLKLCVHRKAGAPGYGSDGAGAEIEVEVPDDLAEKPDSLFSCMMHWYSVAERGVAAELGRLQAAHPQPAPPADDRPPLTDREHPDYDQPPPRNGQDAETNGRRWDPDSLPAARKAYRDDPPRDDRRPDRTERRNGTGGGDRGAPKNGRELIGWANGQGFYDELMSLAKSWNIQGLIKDWSIDDVTAAYGELMVKAPRSRGRN